LSLTAPLYFLQLKKKGAGAKGRRVDPGDGKNRLAKRPFSDFVREISNQGKNNKKNNNQIQYNNTCITNSVIFISGAPPPTPKPRHLSSEGGEYTQEEIENHFSSDVWS